MSVRTVEPELLDHLPPDDPEAVGSRRDLRRINFMMGNERWISRTIARFPEAAARGIVEIGAGGGELAARLARHYPVSAYDLAPRPDGLPGNVVWHRGDLFGTTAPEGGILVANLFLHHFEAEALEVLGRWCDAFDVLVFNEPDRAEFPHFLGNLAHPLINRVTRHDLHASIRAGFRQGEIPRLMRLGVRWEIRETSTWRGARRVLACRT